MGANICLIIDGDSRIALSQNGFMHEIVLQNKIGEVRVSDMIDPPTIIIAPLPSSSRTKDFTDLKFIL